MFTTRSSLGHLARTALVVAAVACGRDGDTSTIRTAEASTVQPFTPTDFPKPDAPGLTTGVLTDITVETGDVAYKAGHYRDAVNAYTMRVQTSPTDRHAFYMLGLSSWKAGDFDGAKVAFDKAIELDSSFAKSYFNGARVLLDMKRAPEALELIEKGLVVDSTSGDGLRLKARAQSEKGDVTAAFATYRDLLIRDDADAWSLNNFGMFLLQHGCVQESIGPLSRAVQVRPDAPLFLNNLGMALERGGYPVTALKHYELAVLKDSTFTKAVKNYGRLKGLVTDSAKAELINVPEQAEVFRSNVRTWKVQPTPNETKPPVDPR